MESELKPCPCGRVPSHLEIFGQDKDKWAYVSGSCCNEWSIEFRNQYARIPSDESMGIARAAWNDAPRADARKLGGGQ